MRYGRRRASITEKRDLTPVEARALALCAGEHWPRMPLKAAFVEWNSYIIIDWGRDAWPMVTTRLPLEHVLAHAPPSVVSPVVELTRSERTAPERLPSYR
jgi:hypothetical protein